MKMEEDIVRELGNLPKSLADLYSLAFSQILELGGTSFSLALNALQLSISAVCPICWPEFQHLLSNCHNGIKRNPTKEEILDVTCNFLEDNVELDQPRLVHPSTREYLGTRPEFSPGNMNLNVSMLCLRSIKELGLNDVPDFAYSSLYLGRHIAATNTTNRHDLRKYLEELLRPSSKLFKIWRERLAWFYKRRANTGEACIESLLSCDPLFTVCALGLEEYLPFVPCDPIRMQKAFASDFSKKPAELGTKARPYVRVLGYNGSFLMPPEYLTECPDILTDFDKKTCVEVTIMMNRIGIIQRLHGLGINLSRIFNSKGENPLHIAANTGSSEMIQVLLECGLDPNEMTKALGHDTNASRRPPPIYSNRSQTAMGFRTYNSGYSGVSSPFYLSQELQAPLHYCVARDDAVAGVRSLIEHGADVNMRTSSGNTPLQLALNAGGASETFCRLLLDAGADPNAIIGQGQTLLHRVAAMGLEEIVQALYDAGANCWLLDSFGRCPYDLAVRYGHTRIVDILKPDSQIKRTGESDSLSKEDIADPSVSHKPLAFGHGTPDSSQNSEHSGHKIGISDDVKREWSRLNMRMA
ncbi:ankyrin repeat-containing domain protein [Daldinia eschscholtzii]|nr:ankyrin repeat-containing domain protein [Daldinia eschscholtzii]